MSEREGECRIGAFVSFTSLVPSQQGYHELTVALNQTSVLLLERPTPSPFIFLVIDPCFLQTKQG
jgi:hypothetical protein